ncbi:hypothetical protein DACRYDRAFT_111882 [Dacryopinax primogenitus]|uniref:Uncharacterized protein n=1 Tax=Dacryopinax primogenitus (strain DJM 731) TaxID=1858805 RepID=M5FR45_DACPD|nr:uncharacterized protein DACRYDRAFT_111882 [Dacryopinax primogenitus]EJT97339.1 hypothetical protein DACRYDRAFT_111882 [Dacryopinax primogenitus]
MTGKQPAHSSQTDLATVRKAILARHIEQLHQPRIQDALALSKGNEETNANSIGAANANPIEETIASSIEETNASSIEETNAISIESMTTTSIDATAASIGNFLGIGTIAIGPEQNAALLSQ